MSASPDDIPGGVSCLGKGREQLSFINDRLSHPILPVRSVWQRGHSMVCFSMTGNGNNSDRSSNKSMDAVKEQIGTS